MTPLDQLQKRFKELDELDRQHEAANGQRGPVPGYHRNAVIQRRNGGVRPQFIDSIGGDSSNYR